MHVKIWEPPLYIIIVIRFLFKRRKQTCGLTSDTVPSRCYTSLLNTEFLRLPEDPVPQGHFIEFQFAHSRTIPKSAIKNIKCRDSLTSDSVPLMFVNWCLGERKCFSHPYIIIFPIHVHWLHFFIYPCLALEFLKKTCWLSRRMAYADMDNSNRIVSKSFLFNLELSTGFFPLFIWKTVDFLLNYILLGLLSAWAGSAGMGIASLQHSEWC